MKLHIVPGINDIANGMVVVARLLAKEQGDAEVVDLSHGIHRILGSDVDEVWVHGMWLPKEWLVCWRALRAGKRLVRMMHGSLSPIYLKYQSPFKKRLVGPIERFLLRKSDTIVATCEAEEEWIRGYEPCVKSIEVTDIKRFYKLESGGGRSGGVGLNNSKHSTHNSQLHLLYLGRRHPLKGLEYLQKALKQLQAKGTPFEFRAVSHALGAELERLWDWCDVLVLPTLSENFGLVVAEALERGKHVITTDGAPAWGDGNEYGGLLIYIRGFKEASDSERIAILKRTIESLRNN